VGSTFLRGEGEGKLRVLLVLLRVGEVPAALFQIGVHARLLGVGRHQRADAFVQKLCLLQPPGQLLDLGSRVLPPLTLGAQVRRGLRRLTGGLVAVLPCGFLREFGLTQLAWADLGRPLRNLAFEPHRLLVRATVLV
jgi:hypothetical protein